MGAVVPGPFLQAVVGAAGEPRVQAAFPTDTVVVSVARSPSNSEWPLQILEPPAAVGWETGVEQGLS